MGLTTVQRYCAACDILVNMAAVWNTQTAAGHFVSCQIVWNGQWNFVICQAYSSKLRDRGDRYGPMEWAQQIKLQYMLAKSHG